MCISRLNRELRWPSATGLGEVWLLEIWWP